MFSNVHASMMNLYIS